MSEYDAEFLTKLKQLCLEYDSKAQFYPESSLEGFAVYYFALHPDQVFYQGSRTGTDYEYYEEGREYRKELDRIWYQNKENEEE